MRTRVHVCRLIASVIRARSGKDRRKWKFQGIAVHTRCFIPDKIYRRPRANVDTILIATLTRIKDKCPAACHRAYHFQLYEDHPRNSRYDYYLLIVDSFLSRARIVCISKRTDFAKASTTRSYRANVRKQNDA